jgi:sporulation protein YlmC with PRC-barrel domain
MRGQYFCGVGTPQALIGWIGTIHNAERFNMFAKSITVGLVGTALLASVAFAQTPTATTDRAGGAAISASADSYQGNWRSSKLVGLNVYNDANESLGSISELLLDQSGKIQAAVIGVGGFLGVGERMVAIPYEKLKFVNEPVASSTAATRPAGSPANTASGTSTTAPTTTTTTTTTTGSTATGTGMTPSAASGSATTTRNAWYPDHAVLSVTKDELKSMPEFKYAS